MKLTNAGQAEILRSYQRDEVFKERLGKDISELLQLWGGIRMWIKYKEISKALSGILYEAMTTMLNLQTLGEEFTGIVQVNRSGTSLPTKYAQVLMIAFNNYGQKLLEIFMHCCEIKLLNLSNIHSMQKYTTLTSKIFKLFKKFLPLFGEIHKTLFYYNGAYYEFGKRLLGIRYALVRYWLKDEKSLPAFRLLSLIFFTYTIIHFSTIIFNYKKDESEISEEINTLVETENNFMSTSFNKCPLCFNIRKDTSITPCGHLFCWSCIILWLQEQPICPICRHNVPPSKVVYLQNYSVTN